MVVGRQPDTILLFQESAGCGDRARDDYGGFVPRDIHRRARGVDSQPAVRDQVSKGTDELVDLAVGSLQHPVRRSLLDALLIKRAYKTSQRG